MTKIVNKCQNLSENVKNDQKMSKSVIVCQNLFENVKNSQNLLENVTNQNKRI